MTAPVEHRPPFVIDYVHDGRSFSVLVEGATDWEDAEAHVASLRRSAVVVGSDVLVVDSNVLTLWIDGFAAWLRAVWLNWRRR